MTFEGGMLKKEPYRSSLTGNSLLEGRITDRSVSCAMARRVGLCSPISGKTCFYSPRGWEVRASRPPRRKCCHSHVSRADQGPYALRGTQGCGWMKKKERMCVWGGLLQLRFPSQWSSRRICPRWRQSGSRSVPLLCSADFPMVLP